MGLTLKTKVRWVNANTPTRERLRRFILQDMERKLAEADANAYTRDDERPAAETETKDELDRIGRKGSLARTRFALPAVTLQGVAKRGHSLKLGAIRTRSRGKATRAGIKIVRGGSRKVALPAVELRARGKVTARRRR